MICKIYNTIYGIRVPKATVRSQPLCARSHCALSAIEAGADRVHGTLMGMGERVGNTPLDLRRARGYTQPPVFPGTPAELGINATSDVVGGNLITTMVGYPRPGPPLPGAAFVGVALGAPNSFYDLWSIFPRPTNPFPKYQGDPIRIDFPLPSDPGLVGLPVFFVWAAVDTGGIDVTPPVGVVLR